MKYYKFGARVFEVEVTFKDSILIIKTLPPCSRDGWHCFNECRAIST